VEEVFGTPRVTKSKPFPFKILVADLDKNIMNIFLEHLIS